MRKPRRQIADYAYTGRLTTQQTNEDRGCGCDKQRRRDAGRQIAQRQHCQEAESAGQYGGERGVRQTLRREPEFGEKLPVAPEMPSRCGTWPMIVTHTSPSMNPRITGVGMKAATQPMRRTPKSRKKRPIRVARVEVSMLNSVVHCIATAPTVKAEISPVAVSGPTTSSREVPSSA